jgi:hypothetical protein
MEFSLRHILYNIHRVYFAVEAERREERDQTFKCSHTVLHFPAITHTHNVVTYVLRFSRILNAHISSERTAAAAVLCAIKFSLLIKLLLINL